MPETKNNELGQQWQQFAQGPFGLSFSVSGVASQCEYCVAMSDPTHGFRGHMISGHEKMHWRLLDGERLYARGHGTLVLTQEGI